MSGILQREVTSTPNVFTEPQQFNAQVTLAGQTAATGDSAMTRDLVDSIAGGLLPAATNPLSIAVQYNGSDQVVNRSWHTTEGYSGAPSVSPSNNLVKGLVGPKYATGYSEAMFVLRDNSTMTLPVTMLIVCRPLEAHINGQCRFRSWNLFANSSNRLLIRFYSTGDNTARDLANIAWTVGQPVIFAISGNASRTSAAIYHAGQMTSGTINLVSTISNASGYSLIQLGAGAGGASGNCEFAHVQFWNGAATENQLRALVQSVSQQF